MKLNESGLTLLEVLVSLIILSIGILGLGPMVVLSIDGNNISEDMIIVSNLAKDKIEEYENLALLPPMPYEESETDIQGVYNRYTVLYDNSSDSSLSDNLCQLKVVIAWEDKSGQIRSTTYSTYLEKG
ncbi:MAG: prepilin-type N-terminal cleavage/methylation domain-containing protein [Calditrichaeota bacterium]|nr:MAG: prepilin-type N-terminal cleavage/methylation domain-containing protein [Calditrichota bacterium]